MKTPNFLKPLLKNLTPKDKPISIYETFAGYSSQEKALRNVYPHVISKGKVEWNIKSIIANIIFEKNIILEKSNYDKKIILNHLRNYDFSNDGYSLCDLNSFNLSNLQKIYPYLALWALKNNQTNINKLEHLPSDIDIFTYSFPCTSLSIIKVNKSTGLKDASKSGMVYKVLEILRNSKDKPKVLLMENVPALISKKHIKDFEDVLKELENLGYNNYYKVLDSYDYGSIQARKRCFNISIRKDFSKKPFNFDNLEKKRLYTTLRDYLGERERKLNPKKNEYLKEHNITLKHDETKKYIIIPTHAYHMENRVVSLDSTQIFTILSQGAPINIFDEQTNKVYRLSGDDYLRLMDLEEKDVKALNKANLLSEDNKKFIAGNSICLRVLEAIFKEVINTYFK